MFSFYLHTCNQYSFSDNAPSIPEGLISADSVVPEKAATKEKQDKSCELSCLVDQTLRISNLRFLEGLLLI